MGGSGAFGTVDVDTFHQRCFARNVRAFTDSALMTELAFAAGHSPQVARNGFQLRYTGDVVHSLLQHMCYISGTGANVIIFNASACNGASLF
eukprot:9169745-Karenia_brevis.AAC.1